METSATVVGFENVKVWRKAPDGRREQFNEALPKVQYEINGRVFTDTLPYVSGIDVRQGDLLCIEIDEDNPSVANYCDGRNSLMPLFLPIIFIALIYFGYRRVLANRNHARG